MGSFGVQTIAVVWVLWVKLIEQIIASMYTLIQRNAVRAS